MKRTLPGEIWRVDFGLATKIRPALILSDYPGDDELALLVVIPHTTSVRGNRWERRGHELADGVKQVVNAGVVAFDLALQLRQFVGEVLVQGQRFAQAHKHAHDGNIHLHRARTAQHARKHRHAFLGENVRQIPSPARPTFEVTIWHLKASASSFVSWNMKSAGKRSRFRWTARLRCLVSTP